MKKNIYFYSNIFVLALVLLLIGNLVFGWTPPSATPPGGSAALSSSQWNASDSGIFYNIGNIGIGTMEPGEKLEVAGAIKIGTAIGTANGTIRWTGSDFEGRISGSWVSLTATSTECTPSQWTTSGSDIFFNTGNVGIGTPGPENKLDVEGDAVIGATYSGTNTAPPNGLLVEGNVGIGKIAPSEKLEVLGAIKIGTAIGTENGTIRWTGSDFEGRISGSWVSLTNATSSEPVFPCGDSVTFTYRGSSVTYGTVENPNTDECWMDRNLGASRVAQAYNDSQAFGDLFQWGRLDDNHQDRKTTYTSNLSSTDNPGNDLFICSGNNSPYDWRSPQNDNLWQRDGQINSPCPEGWRVPTYNEWNDEFESWSSEDAFGAYASPLKLTAGGFRTYSYCYLIDSPGNIGGYWSSTVHSGGSAYRVMIIDAMPDAYISSGGRSIALSVRCIKYY